MVRLAGMSKRCKTCKDRKIKCDEKLPSCSQCEKGGRHCTGPVDGLIFLSTTPEAQRQRALKIGSKKRSQDAVGGWPGSVVVSNLATSAHCDDSELSDGYAVDALTRAVDTRPSPLDTDERMVPSVVAGLTSYQPSLAPALEQHFVSNFISFFDKVTVNSKPLTGWFSLLPTMLSSTIQPYVRAPILAASLALYGTLAHEQAIVLIAYKWYGVGLNRQRKRLIDGAKRKQSMIPTVEDISMALLSAYFEVFFSTSPEAYFQHQTGASKLLGARGPENCQTGVLHELFQTVRFHMMFVTMITHKPSIFATEEWLTIPFAKRSKTVDDRIVDVLTVMPKTLLCSGITGLSSISSTAHERDFELSSQATSFTRLLEALWP
ncbi:hypothetical protein MMC15_006966 [Xylographa vitiligo]|nr:hypothetical protein [Xylographa vitiligo]